MIPYRSSITQLLLLSAFALCFFPSATRADDDQAALVRISGKLMSSRLVRRVPATYPEAAKSKKIEGTVVLEIIVGTNGSVEQIEVLSGQRILAEAAMDAVRQWKYEPTFVKGLPVRVVTRVDVLFRRNSDGT
jgi:protein TonB